MAINNTIGQNNTQISGEGLVEYDITATPRDFTPAMIVELMDSGIMEIPLFQRNFVWDIKQASRLVESLILGLPVPELFLYSEGDENSRYKIIDGQQRILSIYFFVKGRFPKNNDFRVSIKKDIENWGDENFRKKFLADNNLFKDFQLSLVEDENENENENRYNGMKFDTLDSETKIKFRLRRSLRGVVIRQNKPDDNSSMFEIFNRLNTGGEILEPQEIRASLFYCDFYQALVELNENETWRKFYGAGKNSAQDLHCKDVELILRVLALYYDLENYASSMERFLNRFSQKSKKFSEEEVGNFKKLFIDFLDSCSLLKEDAFFKEKSGRKNFSPTLFDSIFVAVCKHIKEKPGSKIDAKSIEKLKCDEGFLNCIGQGSASVVKVNNRIEIASRIITFVEEN
jgi:uncharacterized protein with ParB-like and HNH nuclease domain